jgi:proteasome beta subunit
MHEPWQGLFGSYVNRSFVDLLRQEAPDLLAPKVVPSAGPSLDPHGLAGVPTGTTILALRYADGVIIAGDRQATEGYQIAHRRIEKVYKTDEHSAVAIAGAAGPAIEMARLFQTELEH